MNPQNLPDISLFKNATPIQLRFNDVDVLGHVNNSVYLTFYDTGKANYFSAVQGRQVDWKHVDTVIANINCAFISPIYFGDKIEVLTTCLSISDKSFKLLQIIRETTTGQIKSMCETVMVSFDLNTKQACRVPDKWREQLTAYEGRRLEKHLS